MCCQPGGNLCQSPRRDRTGRCQAVLTMNTSHGAWCAMWFATLPRSLPGPCMRTLPTKMTEASSRLAASRMTLSGSPFAAIPCARMPHWLPRRAAVCSAKAVASCAVLTTYRSLPTSISPTSSVPYAVTTTRRAPSFAATVPARSTALAAVSELFAPTMTVSMPRTLVLRNSARAGRRPHMWMFPRQEVDSVQLEQVAQPGLFDRGVPSADAKLLVDGSRVGLHGVDRDVESGSYLGQ